MMKTNSVSILQPSRFVCQEVSDAPLRPEYVLGIPAKCNSADIKNVQINLVFTKLNWNSTFFNGVLRSF